MKYSIVALCGISLACGSAAVAQDTAPVIAAIPAVLIVHKADVGSSLPSNTEVWLSLNSGLSSKKTKQGDKFDVTVSRDVMLGDYIVIPRGTPGHGQISMRTGKGAFGKSAKMEFDLVDVEIGQRFIPVSGHYRLEGNGNTGATVGAAVAFWPAAPFITGHSATADQGSEWKAYTKEPILVAASVQPAPSSIAAAPVAMAAHN